MLRLILALVLSSLAMLVIGPRVLPILRKLKFGQTIYELLPESQKLKQGTLTMGGLMFAAVTCVIAAALRGAWQGPWDHVLALILISLFSMVIGFCDDYIKVVKKRSLGLTPIQKIIGQVVIAVGFSAYCYFSPSVGSSIILPFTGGEWDLGFWYIPLMSCIVIFMINSANLQDGMDGLLSSVSIIGSVTWALIAVYFSMSASQTGNLKGTAIFCMALAGSLMGFMRFNRYPALVFMGDTGSMFIGGAMVGIAMLMRLPILMLLICFTMIASSLSVIVQRAYFKITHGKRIIRMSPIHYHFEKGGMTETQVVLMYAVVTGVLSLIALLSVIPLS